MDKIVIWLIILIWKYDWFWISWYSRFIFGTWNCSRWFGFVRILNDLIRFLNHIFVITIITVIIFSNDYVHLGFRNQLRRPNRWISWNGSKTFAWGSRCTILWTCIKAITFICQESILCILNNIVKSNGMTDCIKYICTSLWLSFRERAEWKGDCLSYCCNNQLTANNYIKYLNGSLMLNNSNWV